MPRNAANKKPWPFPGDQPLAKARRIALAYRARLLKADPAGCAELDALFRERGESWMVPEPAVYDLDDWLTPGECADIAATSTANIRRLRANGTLHGIMDSAGTWRYQAREVLRVISATRTRK